MKLQRVGGLASERGVIIRGGRPPGRRLLPGLPLGRREPGARTRETGDVPLAAWGTRGPYRFVTPRWASAGPEPPLSRSEARVRAVAGRAGSGRGLTAPGKAAATSKVLRSSITKPSPGLSPL